MNNSNPFVPQGSLLEQKNKKRARVKVAVYSIFACNILLISPLLIQGCKKEAPTDASTLTSTTDTNNMPDTNALPPLPETTNSAPLVQTTNTPVPVPVPVPPPLVDLPVAKEYVVAKGDSYYSIAKKFNLKIKEVEAANPGVTPTKLKVGQKLQIPAGGASASTTSNSTATSDGSDTYVVKSGDSLTKIAKDHGITVKALRTANDLKTDKIKVGEKLKVPSKAAPVDNSAPVTPASITPIPSAPVAAPGH